MNHIFDYLALLIIGVLAIVGYKRGFLEELGRLIGLIVSSIAALHFHVPLSEWLRPRISLDSSMLLVMSYVAIFLTLLIGLRLLMRSFQTFILSKGITWSNRVLGLIFGGMKGLIGVIVILWAIEMVPNAAYFEDLRKNSYAYRYLSGSHRWIIASFGLETAAEKSESWMKKTMRLDTETIE